MSRPSEHRDAPLPRPSTADEERLGTVIDGRYRLDAIVGRGGMGLVYKAEHIGIRRTVALKLLHTTLASVPELRSRFEREARAIGVISHPNCVDVTDFGELADGSLYLVMEYIEGRSLGDVLDRERTLEPQRALRVLRHVLNGLGHAHQVGIVHRDVKPENVLLCRQGDDADFAKILDFGIAKLVGEGGTAITQAGITVGTPAYLSPEQAFGGELDGRSDLYSLSVVLYEMLTGRTPFADRDIVSMLTAHAVAEPPPMSDIAPDAGIPLAVEELVRYGLAKAPADRIQRAGDYVARIDELLGRVPATSGAFAAPFSGYHHASAVTPVMSGSHAMPPAISGTHPTLLPPRTWRRPAAWIGGGILAVGLVAALASRGGDDGAKPKPTPAKSTPAKSAPKPTPPPETPKSAATPATSAYDAAIRDLTKGKTCEQRKVAVARLRELGDARAIPALKKARYRMRGGILGVGDSNTNSCLKADAEAAIAELSKR